MSASVNLWELITTVASVNNNQGDCLPNAEKCQAIKSIIGPRFCSELELTIENSGVWIVRLFDHEGETTEVKLSIHPDGKIWVSRGRTQNGVYEFRSLSF